MTNPNPVNVAASVRQRLLKDFFDIWHLSSLTSFDGLSLQRAVASTFERRATPIPSGLPPALGPEFSARADRGLQWVRLVDRFGVEGSAPTLGQVCAKIWGFARPIFEHLRGGTAFTGTWQPGGPWNPDGG